MSASVHSESGEIALRSRGQGAQKVYLRQLCLTHYRNYQNLRQDFSAASIVLTGHNGAGKTNLLEAISLLSPGRGLRRAPYHDISAAVSCHESVSNNALTPGAAQIFAVAARLESTLYGETQIGTGLIPLRGSADFGQGKTEPLSRRVQINGARCPAENLLEYCRILWLIPAQDGLFTGAAGDRRRFLDRLVLTLDINHARRVLDYEKAMRARNRLLAALQWDNVFLSAVEAQMAELGTAIAAARLETVSRLSAITVPLFGAGSFPQAALSLSGFLEDRLAHAAAIDVEDAFREALRQNRQRDSAAGRSLIGVHRSDLSVLHRAKNMPAALCSTGEQKALLVGLILAHSYLTAELSGMTPILLLDEIAAHLDKTRRGALFAVLEDLEIQAFMTGTDAMLFSALRGKAQFFTADSGCLKQAE